MDKINKYEIDYECKIDTKLVMPKMSKVILLNDDFTTMDFVVYILVDIFSKNWEEAENLMLKIHNEGKAICGIYPYDIAQTKATIARKKSKEAGYPLRIIVEAE